MRRWLALLPLLLAAGCSTAPVADFLDLVAPGRIELGAQPYGGVCAPQGGPIGGPAVPAPVAPPTPPPPPAGAVPVPVVPNPVSNPSPPVFPRA
jgi:hypothetical protein